MLQIRLATKKETNRQKEPHWRRRVVEKQKKLRKDLRSINRLKGDELKNEEVEEIFERIYYIQQKGIAVVHREIKQEVNRSDGKTWEI